MKTTIRFSAFILTFFISVFFTFPFETPAVKNYHPVQMAEIMPETPKIEVQTAFDKIAEIESSDKPEVFKVKDPTENDVSDYNTKFIEPGEITNGDEFNVKSGENWLGFFKEKGGYVLRPAKTKVSHRKKNTLDWKNISVKGKDRPIFMFKDLSKVKKGKVKTLFSNFDSDEDYNYESSALKSGFIKHFQLGERNYTLRTKDGVNEDGQSVLVLFLETESTSQIISFVYTSGEEIPVGSLFWVGDLDGDGKLDFYMDFWNYEKGWYATGMFLSSEAEKGKLVKEFGYSIFGGC